MLEFCPTEFLILDHEQWKNYQEKQHENGTKSTYVSTQHHGSVLVDREDTEAENVLNLLGSDIERVQGVRVTWQVITKEEFSRLKKLKQNSRFTVAIRRRFKEAFVILNPGYMLHLVQSFLAPSARYASRRNNQLVTKRTQRQQQKLLLISHVLAQHLSALTEAGSENFVAKILDNQELGKSIVEFIKWDKNQFSSKLSHFTAPDIVLAALDMEQQSAKIVGQLIRQQTQNSSLTELLPQSNTSHIFLGVQKDGES